MVEFMKISDGSLKCVEATKNVETEDTVIVASLVTSLCLPIGLY